MLKLFVESCNFIIVDSLNHPLIAYYASVRRLCNAHTWIHDGLGAFLFLLLACLLHFILKRRSGVNSAKKYRLEVGAGQALCAVFTPTTVSRPLLYAAYFTRARVRKRKSCPSDIGLDLCELLEHIYTGDLELREASDLAAMFMNELQIYGWNIKVAPHLRWWLKTAAWISQHYLLHSSSSVTVTTQGLSYQWPLACMLRISSRPRPSFDLDFVPYQNLEVEMRRIQSLHQLGNSTIIEFSCLGRNIRPMSADFVLCAALCMQDDNDIGGKAERVNRTPTALFVKLEEVIALISGTGDLDVRSIENISNEHASTLYNLYHELIYNSDLRKEHIVDVGLTGWRKDRIMLAWEAGLLQAGKLTRWRIKLCR